MQCPSCGADDSTCACALGYVAQQGTPLWPAPGPTGGAPSRSGAAKPHNGLSQGPDAKDLLQFLRDFTSVKPAEVGGQDLGGSTAPEAPPSWAAVLTPPPPPAGWGTSRPGRS